MVASVQVRWSYSGTPPLPAAGYKVLAEVNFLPLPVCPAGGSAAPASDFGIARAGTGYKTLTIAYPAVSGPCTTTSVRLQLYVMKAGTPFSSWQAIYDKEVPVVVKWVR